MEIIDLSRKMRDKTTTHPDGAYHVAEDKPLRHRRVESWNAHAGGHENIP
jgi:hypothetical protein